MSSMGVFCKEEIGGKPNLVYTLTQTDNPTSSGEALTMDSGEDDLPLQPLFFCPMARTNFLKLKYKNDDDGVNFMGHPFNSSPHFPSKRSSDQLSQSLLDCNRPEICKLPVVPLFWCNYEEPDLRVFACTACDLGILSTNYFACLQCEGKFHKECVESPLEIKHPSHLFHPLQLYKIPRRPMTCSCCEEPIFNLFYQCTTCEVSMHTVCAMSPIPFVLDHPKSHPHPLTFFPTQDSLVCHICSLIRNFDPTYICIQCVFVIHRDCIGFPLVIRISRHPHRISFTFSPQSGLLTCGVCRQSVDDRYGAYVCNKCDAYFVHSKCALHLMMWDGKDLDGVPDEDDMIDDGEPFQRIADGIILHPFHSHHLRLEIFKAYDGKKYCRGCVLPIYEGQFYSCMECDFLLHESCANAPRMIRHPLYPHPLTLNAANEGPGKNIAVFCCSACKRDGTGFYYEHHTDYSSFWLDLRCAMITEPFEYQGHIHPLFLTWNLQKETRCQLCKQKSDVSLLNCMECEYIICFCCATIPYKVRYKHDSHFLSICDGKEAGDQPDWCEICEGKIKERKLSVYKCNDCCTTLHAECLLGIHIYMKPITTALKFYVYSQFTEYKGYAPRRIEVSLCLNSSLSRPICTRCMRRCLFPTYYRGLNRLFFCSWNCI